MTHNSFRSHAQDDFIRPECENYLKDRDTFHIGDKLYGMLGSREEYGAVVAGPSRGEVQALWNARYRAALLKSLDGQGCSLAPLEAAALDLVMNHSGITRGDLLTSLVNLQQRRVLPHQSRETYYAGQVRKSAAQIAHEAAGVVYFAGLIRIKVY